MGVRFPVLIITIFLLAFAFASAEPILSPLPGACADQSGQNGVYFQSLVCGGTPDSALGLGAVDICSSCYPCGRSDGVCPEDFYTGVAGRGSCRFCPDPDCQVTIDGFVEDASGAPVQGAKIMALYEPNVKQEIASATDASGYYTASVRTGFNRLFVRYQDFDSRIISADILRTNTSIVKQVNFTDDFSIEPGTCSASCTDTFGDRCKASCNGINGCQFSAANNVLSLCDDKLAGTRVFLNDDDYIVCCDVDANIQGEQIYLTADERIDANIGFRNDFAGGLRDGADDLVTFTQRTRSKGERINLQVAVWDTQAAK